MNNTLAFWTDCVVRRKEQLEQHIVSHRAVCDAMYTKPFPDEEQLRRNGVLQTLKDRQTAWIDEARLKLKHAEQMEKFFAGDL